MSHHEFSLLKRALPSSSFRHFSCYLITIINHLIVVIFRNIFTKKSIILLYEVIFISWFTLTGGDRIVPTLFEIVVSKSYLGTTFGSLFAITFRKYYPEKISNPYIHQIFLLLLKGQFFRNNTLRKHNPTTFSGKNFPPNISKFFVSFHFQESNFLKFSKAVPMATLSGTSR